MSDFTSEALAKLERENRTVTGQKETAMKNAVRETLEDFCRQDEEFAQAVVQGRSFADCMREVARGVGGSISDLEAYKRAVQFYFPGAEIRMSMSIDLIGAAAGEPEAPRKGMVLDLTDFL